MKNYRELNISGTILDNIQLEKYMEKIASEHNICNYCASNTYPLEDLKNKYHIILKNLSIKLIVFCPRNFKGNLKN